MRATEAFGWILFFIMMACFFAVFFVNETVMAVTGVIAGIGYFITLFAQELEKKVIGRRRR